MNNEEYNILKLLEEGKTEEYLNERLNLEYIDSFRKTITELISSDCDKKYPSYYARTKLHKGVLKLYRGIYAETDKGFVICHKGSNLFQLYDRSVLTPEITRMLKANQFQDNQKIINFISKFDENNLKPVFLSKKEKENLLVCSKDGDRLIVPTRYYVMAHKLLGDVIDEYLFDGGIYITSPKGKAIVMRRNN